MKPWFLIALAATLATAQSPQAAPQLVAEPVQPRNTVKFEITHVESSQPQIILIFNLEEGTRKMVLPPAHQTISGPAEPNSTRAGKINTEASQPQTIRIFNLSEGTNEIMLPPAP